MTTRIFLVRHGGTLFSNEDRFAGSTDVELSNQGKSQAALLSRRLARSHIDAIYSSDMKRAIDTASAIGARHTCKVATDREFREIDHGHWEGQVHSDIEKKFPEEYAHWASDPFNNAPPGGESGKSVLERSLPALQRLVATHPDKTILLVSHKATNRLMIAALLGIDPARYRDRLAQDLCCLNILNFSTPDQAQLVLLNDISHYANSAS